MRQSLALLCSLLISVASHANPVYLGADLSYVNEMEACGAVYRENGTTKDVFAIFKDHGANLVRVRLWNNATWTPYSNLEDVKKTIRRSKAAGMEVLLDFHYSDDWADGDKQIIPAAWAGITDVNELAKTLYQFTFDTLMELNRDGLMPELVQVGNETNGEILGQADWDKHRPINWQRNAKLFNAGIQAVRDVGNNASIKPRVMLHIAQPENALPWFAAAKQAGVKDFDLIGLSYYAKWSKYSIAGLASVIKTLKASYSHADVLVVETAYPFTLAAADNMVNLLGADSLIKNYPATAAGQKKYLIDLTQTVLDSGGSGTVYWEPAWVSTKCSTRWGQGSSWENATLFDFKRGNELLPAIDFLSHAYRKAE